VSIFELVGLALSRLRSSRLRSGLTMLGIIIGVASVVALVSIIQGATAGITGQLEGLGTNLVTISPRRGDTTSIGDLTLGDAAAMATVDGVASVAPELSTRQLVTAGDRDTTTSVIGTLSSYATVRNWEVWQGSFLTALAEDQGLRVAVLGASAADDLGLGAGDIGAKIDISGLPFTVIGILQPKGGQGFLNQDDQILVPLRTVHDQLLGGDGVSAISVSVADVDAARSVEIQTAMSIALRERHGIDDPADDDFTILDQAQLLTVLGTITGLLTALLGGIAAISLLVGGIGIMNIMLVSVRERTREIGIRKAVGARGRDILLQFLVEALTLSVIGGLIGMALGLAASAAIGTIGGWGFIVSPVVVAAAVGFSLAVGVVFGVWPARQASRLDPIAALRYE
jgi:putative ABC transport system permease protein